MKFIIEEKPIAELMKDLKLYPMMRMKVRSSGGSKNEIEEKLNIILDAELSTNIALLYHGYKNDSIEAIIAPLNTYKIDGMTCKVDFGNMDKQFKFMYRLCDMLSKLDLGIISGNSRLVFLYDDITAFIEQSRKSDYRGTVLTDADFWDLYFKFYEEYHKS